MRLSELFIYALLFGAVLLFNFIMQLVARRAKQRQQEMEQQQGGPATEQAAVPLPAPLETYWGRAPEPEAPVVRAREELPARPAAPARRAVPAAPPGHRPGRTPLFRTRRELRQAIVTMTVLGPCRALQPYGMDT